MLDLYNIFKKLRSEGKKETSRSGRASAIAHFIIEFADTNEHKKIKVLNVGGGGTRALENAVNELLFDKDKEVLVTVVELDIAGEPGCNDIEQNLDLVPNLPFSDGSFDIVVCSDVLEHLEKFHLVAHELVRVSNMVTLISLPIGPYGVWKILLGKVRNSDDQGVFHKYYGLPTGSVLDRHRWWFTYEDVVRFFTINFQGFQASFTHSYCKRLWNVIPSRYKMNFFCEAVWVQIWKT